MVVKGEKKANQSEAPVMCSPEIGTSEEEQRKVEFAKSCQKTCERGESKEGELETQED
jgi:hypothetical protein